MFLNCILLYQKGYFEISSSPRLPEKKILTTILRSLVAAKTLLLYLCVGHNNGYSTNKLHSCWLTAFKVQKKEKKHYTTAEGRQPAIESLDSLLVIHLN